MQLFYAITNSLIGMSFIPIALLLALFSFKRRADIDFPFANVFFSMFLFWCGVSRICIGWEHKFLILKDVAFITSLITAASALPVAILMPSIIRFLISAPSPKEWGDANEALSEYAKRAELNLVHAIVVAELVERRLDKLEIDDKESRRLLGVIKSFAPSTTQ